MVTLDPALAAGATLVATGFAGSTFERYLARRKRHELAWSISLGMFALASAALWWGASTGWSGAAFRTFFLFGAILNVPWLALGSVYLLFGNRVGDRIAVGLAVVSAYAGGVMSETAFEHPLPRTGLPKGSEVFGLVPRLFAGVFSGVSALVVIGLALWSAGKRSGRRRLVIGNLLIATGTLILGASGTLSGRIGALRAFAVTLAVGIVVLFAGFLVATGAPPKRRLTDWNAVLGSAQDAPQDLPRRAAG